MEPNPERPPKTPNGSVLQKLKKLGEIFWCPKVIPLGRILLLQFHSLTSSTIEMKSTKVQTLGGIWWKCWNIWIENTFACIRIIVLGIYRTSFQHNLRCFINACVHVVNN